MATLQELEGPIDEAIVREVIAATPEWWQAAVLEVTCTKAPGDMEGMAHMITSPQGHRDVVQPTDEILDLTHQLLDLFARFGKRWRKVTYRIEMTADGNWNYVADFDY